MSEYLNTIQDIFEYRRRQIDRDMEATSGVSLERFQEVEDTYGRGIRQGLVRFEPDMSLPGSFGILHITEVKHGRRVDRIRTITDQREAEMLIGLQQGASRPK